jgi:hypothetical protein
VFFLLGNDISKERIALINGVERITELSTKLTTNSDETLLRRVIQLLVAAIVVPISLILFTLMMQAIRYHETSVRTRAAVCHIQEDGILPSHRRENITS